MKVCCAAGEADDGLSRDTCGRMVMRKLWLVLVALRYMDSLGKTLQGVSPFIQHASLVPSQKPEENSWI